MTAGTVLPLDQLATGRTAILRQLRGGSELVARLAALGLVGGARLVVLQNTGRGPMLINVRATRIALGRGEAMRVLVEVTGA